MPTAEPGEPARGYISREFTMWCGRCPQWEQHQAKNIGVFARGMVKHRGWKRSRRYGWLCPKCAPSP